MHTNGIIISIQILLLLINYLWFSFERVLLFEKIVNFYIVACICLVYTLLFEFRCLSVMKLSTSAPKGLHVVDISPRNIIPL